MQLPAAFRSLSRPSSAPSAKASALCPYSLDLSESPSVSIADGFLVKDLYEKSFLSGFLGYLIEIVVITHSRLKT